MKIIKGILLIIVGVIAIVLITALFVKNEYSVEREMVINKPRQDVFNYIKILKNQDHYNKWTMMDPSSKRETSGVDGTVGFIARWDSNNKDVGKGEQEITAIKDGERIDLALRFVKPFEGSATTYMTTETVNNNQTKVTWGFKGVNKYPMNFMNLFMGDMLGKDIQTSIVNLKGELEK